jgi:thiamine pyrophosphate-dependent acetolactate synthase large subunit-like protein
MTIQPEERVTRYTREELMLVAEMIHKAKKPYIYLGGGIGVRQVVMRLRRT